MPDHPSHPAARIALFLLAAVLGLVVVVGPSAQPASACSCMATTDAEAFERATAVFVGQVVDYQPPATAASMSSLDDAVWTFRVSEVFKGEVTRVQQLVSAVSGASCGLEIDRQGEYLVFASDSGDAAIRYRTGLCTGTRSTATGAPELAVAPTPPLAPEGGADPPPAGTGSDRDAGGTSSAGMSGAGWAVAGAALVVAAAVGFRALRSRRLTDRVDRR
jgi:hypothetical protein